MEGGDLYTKLSSDIENINSITDFNKISIIYKRLQKVEENVNDLRKLCKSIASLVSFDSIKNIVPCIKKDKDIKTTDLFITKIESIKKISILEEIYKEEKKVYEKIKGLRKTCKEFARSFRDNKGIFGEIIDDEKISKNILDMEGFNKEIGKIDDLNRLLEIDAKLKNISEEKKQLGVKKEEERLKTVKGKGSSLLIRQAEREAEEEEEVQEEQKVKGGGLGIVTKVEPKVKVEGSSLPPPPLKRAKTGLPFPTKAKKAKQKGGVGSKTVKVKGSSLPLLKRSRRGTGL